MRFEFRFRLNEFAIRFQLSSRANLRCGEGAKHTVLLPLYDGVSSGQRQIGPVDALKADMEGSFEAPYDPPSAVDNRQVDMEHRPSGVTSADTDLSGCATYYRECVLLRLVHV